MYGSARWPFWERGFKAKESTLMVFPKAQSCAFVLMAVGGPLYLCLALSQDHLLSGPSNSGPENCLWPERPALSCLRDGWRRRTTQLGGRRNSATSCKTVPQARTPLAGEVAFQVESCKKYVGIRIQSHEIFF